MATTTNYSLRDSEFCNIIKEYYEDDYSKFTVTLEYNEDEFTGELIPEFVVTPTTEDAYILSEEDLEDIIVSKLRLDSNKTATITSNAIRENDKITHKTFDISIKRKNVRKRV